MRHYIREGKYIVNTYNTRTKNKKKNKQTIENAVMYNMLTTWIIVKKKQGYEHTLNIVI